MSSSTALAIALSITCKQCEHEGRHTLPAVCRDTRPANCCSQSGDAAGAGVVEDAHRCPQAIGSSRAMGDETPVGQLEPAHGLLRGPEATRTVLSNGPSVEGVLERGHPPFGQQSPPKSSIAHFHYA